MKRKAWFPIALAASLFGSGCSSQMVRDLVAAGMAAAESRPATTQPAPQGAPDAAIAVHGAQTDAARRPDASYTARKALRSPADVSGNWFVCGERDNRFELRASDERGNSVVGIPFRNGQPIGRLEGRVEGDRLLLIAHLTSTEFGPSPMHFEYALDGDVLKDARRQGPLLSRKVLSGNSCGEPGRNPGAAYPDPDKYPDPDFFPNPDTYPDPDK